MVESGTNAFQRNIEVIVGYLPVLAEGSEDSAEHPLLDFCAVEAFGYFDQGRVVKSVYRDISFCQVNSDYFHPIVVRR